MKKITFIVLLMLGYQLNAQVVASQNFDSTLGWTSTTVTNDVNVVVSAWTRKTTGTTPTCLPAAGAGMAKFDSYDITAGGSGTLTSPAITLAGLDYRVKFKMYRDNGYSTDADNVKVYINTTANLTGATLLGTINRSMTLAPVESAIGWYDYQMSLPTASTGAKYFIFKGTSAYGNNIFVDEIVIEQTPQIDAKLLTFNAIPDGIASAVAIAGSVKNLGVTAITSMDLKWQLNTGTIYSQSLTGLNITNSQTYPFTHSDVWNSSPGQYAVKVWVTNINGLGNDGDLTNDQIIQNVTIVIEVFPTVVVYEEGTGTWCQYCPRGHVGLKDMEHYHNDGSWIGIAVHNADPMTLSAYDTAVSARISGYPSGLINRGASEVDPGLATIEAAYQSELSKIPVAKVSITNQTWNPTTRQITMEVTSNFALDLATANFRMAAIIVENSIVGTGSGYNQVNAYSGGPTNLIDWEGINWNSLGNPVPAASMVYNHVGRALLGGWLGQAGSIPASVTYNTPYSYTFNYTVPSTQNEQNIQLVGILLNSDNGKIVNAKEVGLNSALANNQFTDKIRYSIYPNPTNGIVHIVSENSVSVDLIDILGKTVFSAKEVTSPTNIDLSSFEKGVYLVKITGENGISSEKLILK